MKYFTFLLLLPCILAAEIQNSICSDGTQCPQGKYCCELPSGESGCCDYPKDLEGKSFVPGIPSAFVPTNLSTADPDAMHAYCPGTQCGSYCVPRFKYGVCCSSPGTACPSGTKCCGYVRPWCCRRSQSCSAYRDQCLNGAVTTSTAMISVLLAFLVGMFSKYFL